MLKIAAFTGEINDPSSRYRVRQYIKYMEKFEIEIDDYLSFHGKYPPPKGKNNRIIWGMKTFIERLNETVSVNIKKYDATILQREMISTLKTFENFTPKPRILDVDDAIYLYRKGKFIKEIAKGCDTVICGNSNLAEVFGKWNNHIYILPTAVNTAKYIPKLEKETAKNKIIIGWIGTSSGFKYLYKIEKALNYIINNNKDVELLIVSNDSPKFSIINKYKYLKWSSYEEVKSFQNIDIGLMPLNDDEYARGKCSYKMLQYMSCGCPVVVSPIGMNRDVLDKGNIGFGAIDYYSSWIEYIQYLINNESERREMGKCGRRIVENNYSIDILSFRLSEIIKKTVN